MKYPQLTKLVPAGEHFDESAINEGVYLSIAHIDAIESVIAAVHLTQTELDKAVQINETLEKNFTMLETTHEATKEALVVSAARIKELQDEVAALGGQSSGTGTVIPIKEDATQSTEKVPSYLDDNNPINQYADKRAKKK